MLSKKEFGIVSNLRFISMKTFMLSWVEHEKSFITLGPALCEDVGIYEQELGYSQTATFSKVDLSS